MIGDEEEREKVAFHAKVEKKVRQKSSMFVDDYYVQKLCSSFPRAEVAPGAEFVLYIHNMGISGRIVPLFPLAHL